MQKIKLYIKVSGIKMLDMVKEFKNMEIYKDIKGFGKMDINMVMANYFLKMGAIIKDNFVKINFMEKEHINGKE